MGAFAGLDAVLEQRHAERRQDNLDARNVQADALERSIQIYQQGGGSNPDGSPMSPEQRAQAIQQATAQLQGLYQPHEGPDLLKRLKGIFHKDKNDKGGALPTTTEQPWSEKIPGVSTNPQTGVPQSPHAATPATSSPESLGVPGGIHPKPNLVEMAQKGSLSLGQILSGATPAPTERPYTGGFQRGPDGKYYGFMQDAQGNIKAVPAPAEFTDESAIQQTLREAKEAGIDVTPEEAKKLWEVQNHMAPKEGAAGKPRPGWGKDEEGRIYSFEIDPATGHKIEGTEDYENKNYPPALTETLKTGEYGWVDENNNLHRQKFTTTSRKVPAGGGKATPAAPQLKSRGEKPASAPAATSMKAKGDTIVGYKGSTAFKQLQVQKVKAQVDYNELNSRVKAMDQSADPAKSGDGPATVAIIANYIKSIVGGQGVRVTQTEWNQATQTAPWLQRVGAHFTDDGFFAFTANPLAAEQIDSMIRETKNKTEATKQKLKDFDQQIKEQRASDTGNTEDATPKPKAGGKKDPLGIL